MLAGAGLLTGTPGADGVPCALAAPEVVCPGAALLLGIGISVVAVRSVKLIIRSWRGGCAVVLGATAAGACAGTMPSGVGGAAVCSPYW